MSIASRSRHGGSCDELNHADYRGSSFHEYGAPVVAAYFWMLQETATSVYNKGFDQHCERAAQLVRSFQDSNHNRMGPAAAAPCAYPSFCSFPHDELGDR